MPFIKLQARPGINRDQTNYSGEGGWWESEKIRFKNGLPQKLGGWEKYTIEKHGDWYGIKAHNGKYCADERYKIVCDRDSVGGWERFNVEKIGEEFALRSDRDHKYCADTPGGVNCLKAIPHHSEMFTIERLPE